MDNKELNVCYSINRKSKYVTIYNSGKQYSLMLWNDLKKSTGFSHQELANAIYKGQLQ